jgi:hypothetical protein
MSGELGSHPDGLNDSDIADDDVLSSLLGLLTLLFKRIYQVLKFVLHEIVGQLKII